jgi:hypothetical protein
MHSLFIRFLAPHRSKVSLSFRRFGSHVEGVPHTVRHFLGLWVVGSLLGKTSDVDLLSLRGGGVVRILVNMFNSKVLDKYVDDSGAFAKSDVVANLKGYEFCFRREPTSFVPNLDFVSFVWEKTNAGNWGGVAGDDVDDAMYTSRLGLDRQMQLHRRSS